MFKLCENLSHLSSDALGSEEFVGSIGTGLYAYNSLLFRETVDDKHLIVANHPCRVNTKCNAHTHTRAKKKDGIVSILFI